MVWTLAFPGFVPVQWTVVAIARGGGADGEGGLTLSPISPGSETRNPTPPGRGQRFAIPGGKPHPPF